MMTPTAPSICPTALIISQFIAVTSPRISITTGSFSNRGRAKGACIRRTAKWEGQTCDYPRHHSIALMCDDIDTTVGELRGERSVAVDCKRTLERFPP